MGFFNLGWEKCIAGVLSRKTWAGSTSALHCQPSERRTGKRCAKLKIFSGMKAIPLFSTTPQKKIMLTATRTACTCGDLWIKNSLSRQVLWSGLHRFGTINQCLFGQFLKGFFTKQLECHIVVLALLNIHADKNSLLLTG